MPQVLKAYKHCFFYDQSSISSSNNRGFPPKVFHFSRSPAQHTCATTDLKPTSCLALWASGLLPNLSPLQWPPLGTGGESSLECSPTEGTTRKRM